MTDPRTPAHLAYSDQMHAKGRTLAEAHPGNVSIVRDHADPASPCGKAGCPLGAVTALTVFYSNGAGSTVNGCPVHEGELHQDLVDVIASAGGDA
ncbi:hypothetical protein [Micromonospora rubida]